MKFSKNDERAKAVRTTLVTIGVLASLVILFAFQNCAPVLPLDGVVDSSSIAVRATATPSSGLTPGAASGGGTYTGSPYDGTCVSDFASNNMAQAGTDVPGGNLLAFNSADGHAAFWNLSSGAVAKAQVCIIGAGWTVQAIGDFDGDLNPDIMWRDASGNVVVWLMRGSTRIATALVATVDSKFTVEGVADFNGDGKNDILLRNASNNFEILQMNGSAAPTVIALSAASNSSEHLMEIGSYYDPTSGKRKIALFFNDLMVWYMNGTSIASKASLPSGATTTSVTLNGVTTTSTYTILGVGDFNGDYNSDLLLQDNATMNLTLRALTFNTTTSSLAIYGDSPLIAPAPATWSLQSVQRINGDIFSDWVWLVSGGANPVLGYTPIANSPSPLSSIGAVQTGWTFFKYVHR
jgi:hypothetical protein